MRKEEKQKLFLFSVVTGAIFGPHFDEYEWQCQTEDKYTWECTENMIFSKPPKKLLYF